MQNTAAPETYEEILDLIFEIMRAGCVDGLSGVMDCIELHSARFSVRLTDYCMLYCHSKCVP
jgi:hypothetical protein